MKHVHQIRVPHGTPEGLAFPVPRSDLNLDPGNPSIRGPGHRLFDEAPGNPATPKCWTHTQVGDLTTLGLDENRRGAVNPDDAQAFEGSSRTVAFLRARLVDQNRRVRIPVQSAQ
jgi:hypothetical protein